MLWIFRIAAVIRPVNIASGVIVVQLAFMLLLSVLLLIFKTTGYVIDRREGMVFLGMYFFFVLISVISENGSTGI
ncbi:hypothetical protein [Candidatus Methanoperedens nitratireducens]|uniref:Uncharacterized protein n=1 Tax=Candidatus Methanoperedens nitratireducens TaxID=1392998 RepID=A0A284VLU6_9EURY|nr:hypothetical protein [Candidatus Methanoperedens nitroreducens]SNQ60251.1 hypothetical protein MNV_1720010 [Candidatus Methanoperedens nitroreducens]